jgi:hypothetical protein
MFLLRYFVLYDAGVIRGDLCLAGRIVFTVFLLLPDMRRQQEFIPVADCIVQMLIESY